MGSLAQATWQHDGSVELRFPYDPAFIESLKASVSSSFRTWDPAEKVWRVRAGYAHAGVTLLRRTFPDAVIIETPGEATSRPDPIRSTDSLYATLHLLPSAPLVVIEAAYKALAREQHPDRLAPSEQTRAHEQMVALNTAFATLRDRGAA